MQDLIWFLLPVAALGGWAAAMHSKNRPGNTPDGLLSPEYLTGLNYLLNEQPDKAIDVFARMLEVTSDTHETHLTLGDQFGKLGIEFRRRGEFDRAIRIHQDLVTRKSLGNCQQTEALMELGLDYLRAGMLGHAEELFRELTRNDVYRSRVLPLLLDIYQQEKDWGNAVNIAAKMERVGEQPACAVIAQFYCEMAEEMRHQGDAGRTRELLNQALEMDINCARASIFLGDMEREAGRYDAALKAYSQVEKQDVELLPQVLDAMIACHGKLGSTDSMIEYLQAVISHYNGIAPVLALTDILARERGKQEASTFILEQLIKRPSVRGLARFVGLNPAGCDGAEQEIGMILKDLMGQLQENKPAYKCGECGFSGKTLHWQCPGCRQWNTVKPVHGVEGD
jgi:lipopolysaccharide biosynthesis regulator YciM